VRETLRTRLWRWKINRFPAYRGTGGRVVFLAEDGKSARVEVPLNRRTRNLVGTIFGGSISGAVDPFYMLMFMRLLGPGYVVWDKSAAIRFRRPGRSTLTAEFRITDADLDSIRADLETSSATERTYRVDLVNESGELCAAVEKTIHFRRRNPSGGPGEKPEK